MEGKVVIKNTVEAFKKEDKTAFIRRGAEALWQIIVDGSWVANPEKLTTFSVLMFADLKKYMFYYWFSFPAFNLPATVGLKQCQKIADVLNRNQITNLGKCVKSGDHQMYKLFVLESDDGLSQVPLTSLRDRDSSSLLLTVADPSSSPAHPGWSLRNLVLALAVTFPDKLPGLRVVCLRCPVKEGQLSLDSSLVLTLTVTGPPVTEMPGAVGWERNEKGQMGPRLANMRATMDPVRIAESSVDLNLKLMKWRLVPELDLARLQATRCLLLGAGTLGCGVARTLLGWGVRNISLVDSGKVSYSNPVRQSLFTFQDCLDGGRAKATAAADHLREIFPGVNCQGWELAIPMPGHTATGAILQQSKDNYLKLEQLIKEHDVIFLLMDSRESRWLPTAMAALYPVSDWTKHSHLDSNISCLQEKLVINAALGFDSVLVMRHGVRREKEEGGGAVSALDSITGYQLGCYFCNDVVAPGDSTTDRTLDQQCTVTRPGAAGLASALAVELTVSCLSHPLGPAAPPTGSESLLGGVPHSIRAYLGSFTQVTPVGPVFSQCTGCSPKVLSELRSQGWDMVRQVMDSPKYLEDLTGLTDLMSDADLMAAVLDVSDDDSFSVSSGDV